MEYHPATIRIEGRDIPVTDILQKKFTGDTVFEKSTVFFIDAWLRGQTHFTLQTSGSTGTPKSITVTRRQMEASAQRTAQALSLQAGHTALVCLPTQYIAGIMMLTRALTQQLNIIAVEPSSDPLKNLTGPIDFAAMVPLQVQESLPALHKVKTLIIGGAALPASLHAALQQIVTKVYATYGMTETLSHIALQAINGEQAQSCFHVLPGIRIEQDRRSCLVIHIPEFDEPIVTNDVVTLHSPETFQVIGRWDSIINSGGVKVSPEKIEAIGAEVLQELGWNIPCCVTSVPDERLGEKVVMLLETSSWTEAQTASLRTALATRLTAYEVPRQFFAVPSLVYTETGKVHRLKSRALVQPD
jgi:O-succinylbenzoic acid--CoA ligase